MNGFEQIKSFYSWVFNNQDKNIKPQHISLYNFLINQNNRNNWVEWFKCPLDLGLAGSGIGNKKTYYNCLADLSEWNLIEYKPGVNNYKAPIIKLVVLNRTSTDTATVPQSEPQHIPQHIPLPTHIYKLITNNLKQIEDNFEEFEKLVLNLGKKKIKKTFDLSFIDSKFSDCFNRWLTYKSEIQDYYKTQDGIETAYKHLLKLCDNNPNIAIQIIDQSIGNNYKGLFGVKKENKSIQDTKQTQLLEPF